MISFRMIMLCANLSVITMVIVSWLLDGYATPVSSTLTALNIVITLKVYPEELKELIDKIMGNDDDNMGGGNFG